MVHPLCVDKQVLLDGGLKVPLCVDKQVLLDGLKVPLMC